MKKLLALVLSLTMVLGLSACGGSKDSTTAPGDTSTDTSKGAPAESGEVITLVSTQAGSTADSVLGQGTTKFEELLEEYSGGQIQVESYYDTELGGIDSQLEAVMTGSIDVCCLGPSYLSGYVPEIQVFDLPFLFDDYDQINATLDGDPGQFIASKFEGSGVKLMTYFHSGLRSITNSSRQINSVEDMKGIKIRVAPSETQLATWEGFGAIPMAMASSETFTALQQGTIDAQENGLTYIYSSKIYEAQKYLSLTKHSYTSMPVIMNQDKWDSLTEQQQEWVQKAMTDAAAWQRQATADAEEQIVNDIEAYGLEVNRDPDRESFKPYTQAAYDVFNKAMGSDEILTMVQDYVANLK